MGKSCEAASVDIVVSQFRAATGISELQRESIIRGLESGLYSPSKAMASLTFEDGQPPDFSTGLHDESNSERRLDGDQAASVDIVVSQFRAATGISELQRGSIIHGLKSGLYSPSKAMASLTFQDGRPPDFSSRLDDESASDRKLDDDDHGFDARLRAIVLMAAAFG